MQNEPVNEVEVALPLLRKFSATVMLSPTFCKATSNELLILVTTWKYSLTNIG